MKHFDTYTQAKDLSEFDLQEFRKLLNKSIESASLPEGFVSYIEVASKLKEVKRELNTRYISKRGL